MQAPAPLGTTVVLSFANNGEDTKLDLKNSSWQQRIFDSDLLDLPFREGNHTSPQRHKYSEMVGTHHPVGAWGIVAGRFWAVRGGEITPRHGAGSFRHRTRIAVDSD